MTDFVMGPYRGSIFNSRRYTMNNGVVNVYANYYGVCWFSDCAADLNASEYEPVQYRIRIKLK